jgi:hypothetical protein
LGRSAICDLPSAICHLRARPARRSQTRLSRHHRRRGPRPTRRPRAGRAMSRRAQAPRADATRSGAAPLLAGDFLDARRTTRPLSADEPRMAGRRPGGPGRGDAAEPGVLGRLRRRGPGRARRPAPRPARVGALRHPGAAGARARADRHPDGLDVLEYGCGGAVVGAPRRARCPGRRTPTCRQCSCARPAPGPQRGVRALRARPLPRPCPSPMPPSISCCATTAP